MPSFDTLGWFARDPKIFSAVGDVLLPTETKRRGRPDRMLIAAHAIAIADGAAIPILRHGIAGLSQHFNSAATVVVADKGLESWRQTYRIISAHESWRIHGEWVEKHFDDLSATIAERFVFAKSVSDSAAAAAREQQLEIRRRLRQLVGEDSVLVLPSAPGVAPMLRVGAEEIEAFRQRVSASDFDRRSRRPAAAQRSRPDCRRSPDRPVADWTSGIRSFVAERRRTASAGNSVSAGRNERQNQASQHTARRLGGREAISVALRNSTAAQESVVGLQSNWTLAARRAHGRI
jgi:hypothetical protein